MSPNTSVFWALWNLAGSIALGAWGGVLLFKLIQALVGAPKKPKPWTIRCTDDGQYAVARGCEFLDLEDFTHTWTSTAQISQYCVTTDENKAIIGLATIENRERYQYLTHRALHRTKFLSTTRPFRGLYKKRATQ